MVSRSFRSCEGKRKHCSSPIKTEIRTNKTNVLTKCSKNLEPASCRSFERLHSSICCLTPQWVSARAAVCCVWGCVGSDEPLPVRRRLSSMPCYRKYCNKTSSITDRQMPPIGTLQILWVRAWNGSRHTLRYSPCLEFSLRIALEHWPQPYLEYFITTLLW